MLQAVTPTGDTTTYQWLTNGQLHWVRQPLQTGLTIYTYDATWKNTYEVTNPAGLVLSTTIYDSLGRAIETKRKLTVRIVGEPSIPDTMQWRRTRTWYDALNRVDSTRSERTQNCVAPCFGAAWPGSNDTLQWQQVKHHYDRLSRDTARYNSRGKRTRYAYDGLGRLRMRWPFGDSAAVVDSFRYDIAGNLRFAYTRRGNTIEHRYDARGRDTLTIVPGVGNYRRTFAGPGDQLTRLWIDSYTDPIGGVNPAVSWVYSQSGLLLSDTAQGNRVTTYQYDRYGRDTLVTDVRGTWRLRYDAVRGVLDTVVTAYGDTLRWTIDQRGRAVGPYISNGTNPDYAMIPSWDQVGKLISLRDTHTVNVGRWQVDSTEPNLHLLPLWTETQGSGGPTVTALDTVSHDGWDHVTHVAYFKNGSLLDSATWTFDRDGNIRYSKHSQTYDVATTRLLTLNGNTYTYDRAGNLDTATIGADGWKYVYDALERLVLVRKNGVTLARYAYDVLGRRIVKRVYSGSNAGYLRMVYRGSAVAVEADSGGTLTLGYTSGLGVDNLVAIHKYGDGSDYYVVQDALHSVRGLSRRDGTWIASWRYGIYGKEIDTTGAAPIALRYRWTGREYDVETGLYYFRARYYDPIGQRFVQEDPIGFAGGRNVYAYGEGNPTNTRDPSGLRAVDRSGWYERPPDPTFEYDNCISNNMTASAIVDCMVSYYDIGNGGGSRSWHAYIMNCQRDWQYLSWCENTRWAEAEEERNRIPDAPAVTAPTDLPPGPRIDPSDPQNDPRCAAGLFRAPDCPAVLGAIASLWFRCPSIARQARSDLSVGSLRYTNMRAVTIVDGEVRITYGVYMDGIVFLTSAGVTSHTAYTLGHEYGHKLYGPSEDLADAVGLYCAP